MSSVIKSRKAGTEEGVAQVARFFHYSQNNSGGSFDFNRERGLTHHVVVEAFSAAHANERAESIGLYFDGAGDCPCCGDRWYEAWGDGDAEPEVYGEPVAQFKGHRWMDAGAEVAVHRLDGSVQWY